MTEARLKNHVCGTSRRLKHPRGSSELHGVLHVARIPDVSCVSGAVNDRLTRTDKRAIVKAMPKPLQRVLPQIRSR